MFLVKGSRRCARADLLHRTSALSARRRVGRAVCKTEDLSYRLFGFQCAGGDERARTADPLLAKQVLSQLSYIPVPRLEHGR
jgi:hypothetical protein